MGINSLLVILLSRFQQTQQGSIFWSENDIYSPPPLLKMIFFPPLATCHFSTPIVAFFPKIFPILHLFYPFTSPFLIFFPPYSFFFSLSSFFFYIFPLFLFIFSYFFPQMTSADIFPPPQGGGGVFSIIQTPETWQKFCLKKCR